MNQADAANDGGKISIVVLHEKGMKYEDCLVILRLKDLTSLSKGDILEAE